MAKKMETEEKPAEGLRPGHKLLTSGSLPPFLSLGIGQTLVGDLLGVDQEKREKKSKKKGGGVQITEETKLYYRFKLTEVGIGDDGSKAHAPVRFEVGTVVTFSGAGAVDRAMHKAALMSAGEAIEELPKDSKDWPDADYLKIVGWNFAISREKDGIMKKGDFAGNKVKQYTITYDDKLGEGAQAGRSREKSAA